MDAGDLGRSGLLEMPPVPGPGERVRAGKLTQLGVGDVQRPVGHFDVITGLAQITIVAFALTDVAGDAEYLDESAPGIVGAVRGDLSPDGRAVFAVLLQLGTEMVRRAPGLDCLDHLGQPFEYDGQGCGGENLG